MLHDDRVAMVRLFERSRTGQDLLISTRSGSVVGIVPDEMRHQSQHLWVRLGLHRPVEPASIAVTSFLRGEGVSLVSLALAVAASERGRTLLVDANMARPTLLVGEGDGATSGHRGVRGIIENGLAIEDVVLATDHAELSVLPIGGDPAGDPSIEFDPALAQQLFGALSLHYDTVIVDSPSLQEPAAAVAVAAACDACLAVVHHRVTDIEQVQSAADQLVDTEFLGVVLNATRLRTPRWLRRRLGARS